MTNKQITELNELLVDHGKTLTAFYDEAFDYGWKQGLICGVIGCVFGFAIVAGVKILIQIKGKKEKS